MTISKKLLQKSNEKNFVEVSESEIKITPVTKTITLYLEYPREFFDLIRSKADIIANNGIYRGLNNLLKNSCDRLSNCFGSCEH